ncbi:MAG: glycoside hydrolase family 1 protein, partial [Candidatus Thorarchaeota archaeon]
MHNSALTFPKGFLWGVATSAHQIEGGNKNNQWWKAESERRIKNGDTSEIACDHWNRYEEDFAFLTEMNLNAYRFSLEWSRVFPEPGEKDPEAIEHYHKMIDALLKRKITPFLTLHHFTHPIWLEQLGGLKNQKRCLEHFKQYVELVADEFHDKIGHWNTINEPGVVSVFGYFSGHYPPFETSMRGAIRAANTLMRMHAVAYHALKQIDAHAKVGLVKNLPIFMPLNLRSRRDRLATRIVDYLFTGASFRALRTGKSTWGLIRRNKLLRDSSDFLGLNYYTFALVSQKNPDLVESTTLNVDPELLCADLGWEPYPEGLLLNLRRLQREFPNLPIYITENGIGTNDDPWRQQLLIDHLKMTHQALQEGIDVRGYFHWSLLDNFEWVSGYSPRFGLVHVDYTTQQRTMKESSNLYAAIAKH